jgi:hypothetical protein
VDRVAGEPEVRNRITPALILNHAPLGSCAACPFWLPISARRVRLPEFDAGICVPLGELTGTPFSGPNFQLCRPYDQTLGEPLARTGRYAKVAESGFRAPATYQKLKVAEKHSPLSGYMHASPYIIVEEQWKTL